MADRPNFFELLDLSPEETRWPEIEKRIKQKKGEWAKGRTMGNPKKQQEAKRNLDLLPEILRVLQDPALRRQEAEDALRRRDAARQSQEKKLTEWIELLRGGGLCPAEQFEKIRVQFEGFFSEQEIRARFAAAGIRVAAGPKPPRERTDPVTARRIRENLKLLGLANLYEFLGLPPNSRAEDLRKRAEGIYQENQRLGRTDVEATAGNSLAGDCKIVFQSEEEKVKYDNDRLLEAVEAIEDQLQAVVRNGVLAAKDLDTLIRLAAQHGVPPDEVREALEERAAKEGWKIEPTPAGPAPASGEPAKTQESAGGEGEPPAPARMIVRPIPGGLRLSWEPVRLPDMRYRVLRKEGSVPWDEGDGALVAQTGETQADDAAVPPGIPWHYAVFSLRNGLASSVPAHSGPHVVSAERSRNLGGLPVRRLAAAGLATAALGGGAALLWNQFPNLLAGAVPHKVSQTPVVKPNPGQPPSPGPNQGANSGGGSGAPVNSPGGQTTTASSSTQPQPQNPQTAAGGRPGSAPPLPVPPSPSQNPSVPGAGHGTANVSGNSTGSSSALADTATRTPVPSSHLAVSLPAKPEVAVVAVGDPLLASPLEDELEKSLRGEGIGVVSASPALDSLRRHREASPSISEILASLRADGVHAAVIAQVDRVGDRELSFYGRKDVAATSRVKIFAYLVDGRRALGSGWSEQIDYTTASASSEGGSAAHRAAGDLADAVRDGWGSLRGASRTP